MNKKLVSGVGINTKGEFKTTKNGKPTKVYATWTNMLFRCYGNTSTGKHYYSSYEGCTVSTEWRTFQTFAKWYTANYTEGDQLDKDILIEGNKIYSADTCAMVSPQINLLLGSKTIIRDAPGVCWHKGSGKYHVMISRYCKIECLGYYKTIEEAFEVYKLAKEMHLYTVATEEYIKGTISIPVFLALVTKEIKFTIQ